MDPGPQGYRHHPTPPTHAGGAGGREDCWSEGASEALIEAWGDRYLQLSRGNLRQKDWKEVADAVNDRQEVLGKPRKTDVQCKNRIDTLKKKYKLEKSKPGLSQWPLFSRLDLLIGPNSAPSIKNPNPSCVPFIKPHYPQPNSRRHPSLTFTIKPRNPNPNAAVCSDGSTNSPGSSESSRGEFGRVGDDNDEEDDDDENEEDDDNGMFDVGAARKKRRRSWASLGGGGGEEGAFGELARAIVKFAEVYERVERSKHQQMMELEKQRMEFAKDIEFQRMQMFMDAQLELDKMKRPKHASGSEGHPRARGFGDGFLTSLYIERLFLCSKPGTPKS
ncbi:trihelix transcription factor ASIL2 isoform X3 [Phoenix dactylifera]|uniref:Trihelix transcription factor ASIL2 isoform X3 n=1 Tax=Phoenix dactylifera TaxID=42345 RepID=A0A8B9AQ85_PHODC|nr:trihelix transcription factor ASIL2 isoform X3 [Phoenix dactylifera]